MIAMNDLETVDGTPAEQNSHRRRQSAGFRAIARARLYGRIGGIFRVNPRFKQMTYKPSVVAGKPGLLTCSNSCSISRSSTMRSGSAPAMPLQRTGSSLCNAQPGLHNTLGKLAASIWRQIRAVDDVAPGPAPVDKPRCWRTTVSYCAATMVKLRPAARPGVQAVDHHFFVAAASPRIRRHTASAGSSPVGQRRTGCRGSAARTQCAR